MVKHTFDRFFYFPNRPKSARLQGFRRFLLSYGENAVYAPKCRALPTGRNLGITIAKILYIIFVIMSITKLYKILISLKEKI